MAGISENVRQGIKEESHEGGYIGYVSPSSADDCLSFSCSKRVKEERTDDVVHDDGIRASMLSDMKCSIGEVVHVKTERIEEGVKTTHVPPLAKDKPPSIGVPKEENARAQNFRDAGIGCVLINEKVGNSGEMKHEDECQVEVSKMAVITPITVNARLFGSFSHPEETLDTDDFTLVNDFDSTEPSGGSVQGHFRNASCATVSQLFDPVIKQEEDDYESSLLKKPFACGSCSFRTKRRQTLQLHIMRNHTSEKPFCCDICDYKCCSRSQLKRHKITHLRKKPYTCDLCDYQCTKSEYLKAHVKTHNRVELKCDHCDYVCNRTQDMKAHGRIHKGESKFSCSVCHHKCDSTLELESHINSHLEERPFACEFCDYRTKRAHRLKQHMMRHTGEKPLACNVCNYRTSDTSTYKRHLKSHTGEKPFSCDVCHYRCARVGYLKAHMRTHTKVKLFPCEDCDYKASDSGTLRRHVLTHTGEKPFTCDMCDYRCRRACHLKSHMKTHAVS